MLKYFKYSRELKAISSFHEKINQLYELEERIDEKFFKKSGYDTIFNHREIQQCIQMKGFEEYGLLYKNLRVEIAQKIPKIRRIATEIGVQTERYSCPSAASGSHVLPVGIFDSILEDLGYVRTEHTTREDTLNKMIGILKETKKQALIQLLNPLAPLRLLLRMPFLIIKQTGFNTDKIEDELIGKTCKLLFLIILIYLLLELGFTQEQLVNVIRI